jgi:hypothetical protein
LLPRLARRVGIEKRARRARAVGPMLYVDTGSTLAGTIDSLSIEVYENPDAPTLLRVEQSTGEIAVYQFSPDTLQKIFDWLKSKSKVV